MSEPIQTVHADVRAREIANDEEEWKVIMSLVEVCGTKDREERASIVQTLFEILLNPNARVTEFTPEEAREHFRNCDPSGIRILVRL